MGVAAETGGEYTDSTAAAVPSIIGAADGLAKILDD
jgi:hypothetical protein